MIEKVNPSHPDKVADRIAGALVDLAYTKQENPKIAVEVLIGHGVCHIIAETSVEFAPGEIVKGLNEAQKRKYRLLDNKTGEFAQWDFKKLKEEVKDLDFGFDFGIDGLLQRGDNLQELKEKNSKPKNDTLTKVCTCPRCGNQWEE